MNGHTVVGERRSFSLCGGPVVGRESVRARVREFLAIGLPGSLPQKERRCPRSRSVAPFDGRTRAIVIGADTRGRSKREN